MVYYIYDQEPFLDLVRENCLNDDLEKVDRDINNLFKIAALGSFQLPRSEVDKADATLKEFNVPHQEGLDNAISNWKDLKKMGGFRAKHLEQTTGISNQSIEWDILVLLLACKKNSIELEFPQDKVGRVVQKVFENLRNVNLEDPNRFIYV